MRVDIEKLSLSYDGRSHALEALDLVIPSGSLFGLIGPNGAGKSTSLKVIAGLLLPSAGRVGLDGAFHGEADFAQRRRAIGFVGDARPFERGSSAREHLTFFARAHGLSRSQAKERAEELLVELNLQDKAESSCRSLSKGMKQRLALGRACVHRPRLLILDEPADGLDPQGRADLRNSLRKIHASGDTTIIISSHVLRELDELCDEVAILQRGKLAVHGSVQEIQEQYLAKSNRYRAQLLLGESGQGKEGFERLLVDAGAILKGSREQGRRLSVEFSLSGGEPKAAQLVRRCVQEDLALCALERMGSRLEEIYQQLADPRVN